MMILVVKRPTDSENIYETLISPFLNEAGQGYSKDLSMGCSLYKKTKPMGRMGTESQPEPTAGVMYL